MTTKNQHVMPHPGGGWSVRSSGAARASRVFDSQTAAVGFAKDVAKRSGTELFVHGKDGMVETHRTFGRDRAVPKA